MSARLRSFALSLALALASLALALLLLELVARATGLMAPPEPAVRRMVDARWTTLLDCYPSNPRGYFEIDLRQPASADRYRSLAPHRFDEIARGHPWAVESRYNSLRFRDAEPDAKRSGVARVLVFGDSFAEGQGVKNEDTLAAQLGRLLDERAPGRFEVRNAGRRGLDFPELSDAFEKALAYEPDLVLYALTLNDAVQPPEFRARQSFVNDWILDRERAPDEAAPPGFSLRVFDFVRGRVGAWRVGRATTAWYLDMWSDRNPGWRETQRAAQGDEACARRPRRAAPGRAVAALRRARAGLSVRSRRTGRSSASACPRGSLITTCCRRSRAAARRSSGSTRSTTTRTRSPTASPPSRSRPS